MLISKHETATAYLYLLPALLVFGVFTLYPFLAGIVYSTLSWDGVGKATFIGLRNFARLARDHSFLSALGHNVLYAAGTVTGKIIAGFIFAWFLNSKIRFIGVYRTVFFVPVVMSFVAVGLLWRWIYNPIFGLFDVILQQLRIVQKPIGWLSEPGLALWSIMLVDIWKFTAYHAVIFLAGLQMVPDELYEAAEVDGAKLLTRIFRITLPSIRSVTIINTSIALMGAFSVFDLIYIMTGGGPYDSTQVLLTYMYRATFKQQEFGYGTAMAVVLFAIVVVISLWQQRQMRREG